MKARDAWWWGNWPARRKSYETQRENAMTIYRRPRIRGAHVPSLVIAVLAVLGLTACGTGGGDGAEDTGSLVTVTQQSGATQMVNVDVASSDPANPITDAKISVTFTNESVVPDATPSTSTELVLYSCTVSYTSNDPVAPQLHAANCTTELTLPADSSVDMDLLLMPLVTIVQFDDALTALPDHPVEYEAHYTFEFRNVPFDQSQTVRPSPIRFSMGDFADGTTTTTP